MAEMKFCEDCTHLGMRAGQTDIRLARCWKTAANAGDQFLSRSMPAATFDDAGYCSHCRLDETKCGRDAKWFEARVKEAAE